MDLIVNKYKGRKNNEFEWHKFEGQLASNLKKNERYPFKLFKCPDKVIPINIATVVFVKIYLALTDKAISELWLHIVHKQRKHNAKNQEHSNHSTC